MELSPEQWLEVVRTDYLQDFVRQGGAAVKLAVPDTAVGRHRLSYQLAEEAARAGYQFALVDAASTKLHLVDRLFSEVARQTDWDALCFAFLTSLLSARGLSLPPTPEELTLAAIAELNGRSEALFRNEVRGLVERELFGAEGMSQEFRIAMIRLCFALLDPDDDPLLRDALKEWLRGELRLVSAVKRAPIFRKVARHNGRYLLFSLPHWLKLAGKSGLLLALDVSRYAVAKRPAEPDGSLYFSASAALDTYELLRQFIDATDELAYCFVAVLAGSEFLADDRRGLRSYNALYLRVADEVRDRYRPNPLGALVRLEGPAAAPAAETCVDGG
jgi:hypothetical protein